MVWDRAPQHLGQGQDLERVRRDAEVREFPAVFQQEERGWEEVDLETPQPGELVAVGRAQAGEEEVPVWGTVGTRGGRVPVVPQRARLRGDEAEGERLEVGEVDGGGLVHDGVRAVVGVYAPHVERLEVRGAVGERHQRR